MKFTSSALALVVLLAACSADTSSTTVASQLVPTSSTTSPSEPVSSGADAGSEAAEFARALLRVEINATDGDAGLQLDLDHDAWKTVSLTGPDGSVLLDVTNHGVLEDYGLTELFSESSEPPFDEFPLDEFKQLFPEGEYVFEGETIEGTAIRSTFTLTHAFPEGPEIMSPEEDDVLPADGLVVEWKPVTEPAGIDIARYQVLVINEQDERLEFSATVPADVTKMAVPNDFLALDGEYKVEVLAIETSGNQTLNEVVFNVG